MPDRMYENIDVGKNGEVLNKTRVCGPANVNCPSLTKKENVIGMLLKGGLGWSLAIGRIAYRLWVIRVYSSRLGQTEHCLKFQDKEWEPNYLSESERLQVN